MRRLALACGLALALAAGAAGAHQRSLSYSSWVLDAEGARVHARVSQLDLSRLGLAYLPTDPTGGARDPVAHTLAQGLRLSAGGEACRPVQAPTPREAPEGWVVYAWRVACAEQAQRAVESDLFLQVAPSHLHFARVDTADGATLERVLTEAQPRWPLLPATQRNRGDAGGGTDLRGYLALGVEHILTGWDHLAFVLALLLLAGTLAEVAGLVTAFTVAHSVTLGLATLGLVEPQAAAVEALIGFSIALVAVENAWILGGRDRLVPLATAAGLVLLALLPPGAVSRLTLLGLALFSLCHFGLLRRAARPARLRAAVAFAFGLVHGFGFAGVLAELELPTARLVPALLGFNLGVELGQLAVVVLVWPALRALARPADGRLGAWVAEAGSAAVCALGLFWFLTRTLGA